MMRVALAWVFFAIGDSLWRVFDQWLPFIGMRWPIYRLYHWCMCASDDLQGDDDRGPWDADEAEAQMLRSVYRQ